MSTVYKAIGIDFPKKLAASAWEGVYYKPKEGDSQDKAFREARRNLETKLLPTYELAQTLDEESVPEKLQKPIKEKCSSLQQKISLLKQQKAVLRDIPRKTDDEATKKHTEDLSREIVQLRAALGKPGEKDLVEKKEELAKETERLSKELATRVDKLKESPSEVSTKEIERLTKEFTTKIQDLRGTLNEALQKELEKLVGEFTQGVDADIKALREDLHKLSADFPQAQKLKARLAAMGTLYQYQKSVRDRRLVTTSLNTDGTPKTKKQIRKSEKEQADLKAENQSLKEALGEFLASLKDGSALIKDLEELSRNGPEIAESKEDRRASAQKGAEIGFLLQARGTPHVMQYHDVRKKGDLTVGTMAEVCRGGDATKLIPVRKEGFPLDPAKETPLSPEERLKRLNALKELAETVADLHDPKIDPETKKATRDILCLCDFKTENVFYDGEHIRLGDFGGIVRMGEPMQESTPLYAASETRVGRAAIPKSDMYAFGLIMFELLHGPLNPGRWEPDKDAKEYLFRLKAENPATYSPLDDMIVKLLTKGPTEKELKALAYDEINKIIDRPEASDVLEAVTAQIRDIAPAGGSVGAGYVAYATIEESKGGAGAGEVKEERPGKTPKDLERTPEKPIEAGIETKEETNEKAKFLSSLFDDTDVEQNTSDEATSAPDKPSGEVSDAKSQFLSSLLTDEETPEEPSVPSPKASDKGAAAGEKEGTTPKGIGRAGSARLSPGTTSTASTRDVGKVSEVGGGGTRAELVDFLAKIRGRQAHMETLKAELLKAKGSKRESKILAELDLVDRSLKDCFHIGAGDTGITAYEKGIVFSGKKVSLREIMTKIPSHVTEKDKERIKKGYATGIWLSEKEEKDVERKAQLYAKQLREEFDERLKEEEKKESAKEKEDFINELKNIREPLKEDIETEETSIGSQEAEEEMNKTLQQGKNVKLDEEAGRKKREEQRIEEKLDQESDEVRRRAWKKADREREVLRENYEREQKTK